MKWIGQHIWDFISRFRSDVYLEAIDTSTETDMLVVDSAGKVTKRAIDAITVDVSDFMTNGADNRVLTATGTDAINAEANLTYTGETLFQTHTPTGSANFAYLIDTNDYLVTSHSTTSLSIDCQAAGVTGDGLTYIGKGIGINVEDYATNHANATSKLTGAFIAVGNHNAAGTAEIKGIETIIGSQTPSEAVGIYQNVVDGGTDLKFVSSADTGDYFSISTIEDGETTLATLENGGGSTAHLNLDADGDIVLDSASGVIKTGSTTFVNNSGVIQVATQGTIDHDSLANFVTAEHVDWAGASAGIIHSSNVSTLNQDTTGTAATVTGAAQTNITSVGTLTNLDVDNININGDTITASADLSIVATGNDIAVDTDNLVIESATSAKPVFELKNTTVDNTAPTLKFTNTNGGTDGDLGDYAGTIEFTGNDDGTPSEQIYGQIFVRQHVAVSDEESGDFTILVAAHDGDVNPAFRALGGSVDSEVDVTIASGVDSVTTIAGNLQIPHAETTVTNLITSGNIELGHATDTTLARSAAGIATIQGEQIFTTNTPALTSAAAGVPAVTMQVRRTITTAEANAMNSTPIVLVPAQGANTVIVPLGGMVRVDRAANQTNASADWNVHYEDDEPGIPAATSLMHIRRFMYGQGNDTIYHVIPSMIYNETGQALTKDVDKDMEVSFDAATTTDCFTSIEVFLTYQVFNIS